MIHLDAILRLAAYCGEAERFHSGVASPESFTDAQGEFHSPKLLGTSIDRRIAIANVTRALWEICALFRKKQVRRCRNAATRLESVPYVSGG